MKAKKTAGPVASEIVRGFATTRSQADDLAKYGLPDKSVYLSSRGAESLEMCLDSFRGRPGRLIVAHDLRLFGLSKREVAGKLAQLEKGRIVVTDISHPGDTTISEMLNRAHNKISRGRFDNRRAAKRYGSKGGLGKGVGAAISRDGAAPQWLVDRIVDARQIPWVLKLELLAPHFSESTLRRYYGRFSKAKRN